MSNFILSGNVKNASFKQNRAAPAAIKCQK
nr:MAG TPA: hypothetical protein [Inoviridae sp.]